MAHNIDTDTRALDVQTRPHPDGVEVALRGAINERADLDADRLPEASTLVLDLAGIERINSIGVQQWAEFLKALRDGYETIAFERCPAPLIQQFNMIPITHRGAEIRSVMLPYFCEECGHFEQRKLDIAPGTLPDIEPEVDCPECDEEMLFDDLPEQYLAFLH